MSKVEGEGGGAIDSPPLRLHVTIFSRRLLGLIIQVFLLGMIDPSSYAISSQIVQLFYFCWVFTQRGLENPSRFPI